MKITDIITHVEPMKRFRQYWTAKLVGLTDVEGTGKDRDEATIDLLKTIVTSLKGDYAPILISFKGHIALIWRERASWYYTITTDGYQGSIATSIHTSSCNREQTERHARRHMADYVADAATSFEESEAAAAIILNEEDRRNFLTTLHRTRKAKELMLQEGLNWVEANMKIDGLLHK